MQAQIGIFYFQLTFVSVGQPMLNFRSFSWHSEKKVPMHQESGFLRIKPGSNQVSMLVAHNFGRILKHII
jgi:hypothetical protein